MWTALTALNAYLSQAPRVGFVMVVAVGISGLMALSGWASYVFYRRHPEAEQITPGNGGAGG